MATITKLPSGKFRAQIRRQGLYRAQTFARKLDAQAWAVELERAIESGSSRGTIRPTSAMLLSDLIDAYIRQARVSRAAELALLQIGRTIGKIPLRQFNALHVHDWIQSRQADGLQTASILRPLGRLSRMLQWARDIKQIDIDPGLVLEARRKLVRHSPGLNRHRDRIPTAGELMRLRTHFAASYTGTVPMKELMDFALVSAMRVGEICRITFEDVDWDQHTVIIRDRKAVILAQSISVLGLPQELLRGVEGWGIGPLGILGMVVLLYIVLGTIFDGLSMMIMTLPIVFPLLVGLGYDPVWLGVLITLLIEIGMLTPPVGMNLYVLTGMTNGQVKLGQAAVAALPYWLALLTLIALIVAFPGIVTWLPSLVTL